MRRNLVTIAFLFFAAHSFGQNTLLWKITNPNNKNVSYLFGTYHLFGNSFVDSFPVITEKLKTSDVVVTEVKFDRPKAAAYYNARPASTSLASALSRDDIAYLSTIFKTSEIDINKYSPGELLVKLQAVYPKYKCPVINVNDKYAMDEYIQRIGDQQQKTLYFLESDSMQLEKIYEATKAYDWNIFKQAAPALLAKYKSKATDESLCSLANQYASFTIDYKLHDECKGGNMNDMLVKKRNEDWMKKLPALSEKNNCFIALGFMHLFNKCGLIEQLRALGYSVEPVSMK